MKRISNIIESEVEPVETNSYWYNTFKKKLYRFGSSGWEEIGKQSYARRKSSKRSAPQKPIVGWIHGIKLNINSTVADKFIVKGANKSKIGCIGHRFFLLLTDTILKACTIYQKPFEEIEYSLPQYVKDLYKSTQLPILVENIHYDDKVQFPWDYSILSDEDVENSRIPTIFNRSFLSTTVRFYVVVDFTDEDTFHFGSRPIINEETGKYNTDWEWKNRDLKNYLIHHALLVDTNQISNTGNLLGVNSFTLHKSVTAVTNLDAVDPWNGEPIIFRGERFVTASKYDKYILARPTRVNGSPNTAHAYYKDSGMGTRPINSVRHRYTTAWSKVFNADAINCRRSLSHEAVLDLILNGSVKLWRGLVAPNAGHKLGEYYYGHGSAGDFLSKERRAFNLTIYRMNPWSPSWIQDELAIGKITLFDYLANK